MPLFLLRRTVLMSVLLFVLSLASSSARAVPTIKLKVGDRVEAHGISNPLKGVVREIGTGNLHGGCYLIRFDYQDKDAAGNWVCPHEQRGVLFLLDADDEIVGDIYAPVKDKPKADTPKDAGDAPKNDAPDKATPQKGIFKVGDRVEVLSGGKWYPGTVTRGLEHNAYQVAIDKFVGTGLADWQATPERIRALNNGGKAPAEPVAPPQRKPIKCPQQTKAKVGPPPAALVKKLIQCLWEDNGDDDKVVNVDIHSIQIGAPRRWVVGQDMGSGGPQTLVYPVFTRWTMRTYQQSGVTIAEKEGVHNFYINAFGVWQCGLGESKDVKPLRFIGKKTK